MHSTVRLALLMVFVPLLLIGSLPQAAQAAGVVGNGTAASCTEAAFTSALSGGGAISFNCGGATTIVLTTTKVISANTTINGGGVITLSGNNSVQLFNIGGVQFTLNNITLTRGRDSDRGGAIDATGAQITLNNSQITNSSASNQGGAIYCYVGTGGTLTLNNSIINGNRALSGAGIYNDTCALTVRNSRIVDNLAEGAITQGGGIYTTGKFTSSDTLIQGNRALDGGGLYITSAATADLMRMRMLGNGGGYGGAIENSGTLNISDSLLSDNSVTGSGGGLWNLSGTVDMKRTSIINNSAGQGGGISNQGTMKLEKVVVKGNTATTVGGGGIAHTSGTLFVTDATLSHNRATGSNGNGGGIYQNSDDNLTLTNVTISNNTAARFGGGFYHRARYAVLTNVTLAYNTATLAGNALYEDANVSPQNPGIIQMRNSVILGSANNCDGAIFDTLGNNLSGGICSSLIHATDQHNVSNARMGTLAYNGGSFAMETILPLPNSPVINAANNGACASRDQRGASRVGVCDIGAVEYGAQLPFLYLPLTIR